MTRNAGVIAVAAFDRIAVSSLAPAGVAIAAAAACTLTLLFDPNEPGFYPRCPFLALTGRWCPGCGSLRGMNALLRGDVGAAVGFNVLMVLAIPYLLYAWTAWALRTWTSRDVPPLRVPATAIWMLLAVIGAFWVARNLPWAPLASLAP